MKYPSLFILSLLGLGGSAVAELPKFSITVQDGRYSDVYGLNPTASWSNRNQAGNVDIDYGIETDLRVTKDITSLPKSLWGKVSSTFGPWGLSAKVNFEGLDYTNADVKFGATNAGEELTLSVDGSYGNGGIRLNEIQGTKKFLVDDATITVNPRLDVNSDEATVFISYDKDGTSVEVEACKDVQTVTLSRQLDSENRITPTFSNSGALSIDWEHKVNDSTITTTFKPEKSINVVWEEGGWNADINMDLKNNDITNVKIGVKKDISF
mmetsp:Transcript_5932/g.7292  ORF Transcript_5932/g.7292 Transcript_5932/m.7292 type:complete len:267 (-) Transcript_5932:176-976(-)